ncbi:vWA domain-containing protein [Lapillicoccus jejuensis]|uniref:Mg-chelatase subunit ChlD n=1 Tax=Lapillicoccus jejuensis TaxID=402171 RepID=A0A542DVD9_9MICO|nr:vWA domain-containing protein [Lapillicoccus jejuensis]TQJ07016.1 Mg-chelatase subunit ChlD [Lapillicoccus jejuensis]
MTPETASGAPNPFSPSPPRVLEHPDEVGAERQRQAARTTSRAELTLRHPSLDRVSRDVGDLEEAALGDLLREDPDEAMALLADLARATDVRLRAAARRLARSIALRPPSAGAATPNGRPRLTTLPQPDGGDLDLDATLGRLDATPYLRGEDLHVRDWRRRGTAYVLLVDVSGSVAGARLATAVLAAGALASRLRPGDELAVVAFARDALVLRAIDAAAPPGDVVDALLDLRGHGTTDVAHGLTVGLRQAARARSPRREVVVLGDGVATAGGDASGVASDAGRLGARIHVLAVDDADEARTACRAIAAAGGGRVAPLRRPSDAADALATVLA